MKKWLSALMRLHDTTNQIQTLTEEIEELKKLTETHTIQIKQLQDLATKAEHDAEKLRAALQQSDGLTNDEFDRLTIMVEIMSDTLTSVIQVIKDSELKERILRLRRSINWYKTNKINNRNKA